MFNVAGGLKLTTGPANCSPFAQRDRDTQMLEAQHSREVEAATRRQEEVEMIAKIAAETQRRMEVS